MNNQYHFTSFQIHKLQMDHKPAQCSSWRSSSALHQVCSTLHWTRHIKHLRQPVWVKSHWCQPATNCCLIKNDSSCSMKPCSTLFYKFQFDHIFDQQLNITYQRAPAGWLSDLFIPQSKKESPWNKMITGPHSENQASVKKINKKIR